MARRRSRGPGAGLVVGLPLTIAALIGTVLYASRLQNRADQRAEAERVEAEAERLIDIDQALEKLRAKSARMAGIVECRYFAGLSEEETARALGVSLRTAQREWMRARAWLREALDDGA